MRRVSAENLELASLGLIHDLSSPLGAAAGAFRVLEVLLGQGDQDTRFFRDTVRASLRDASTVVHEWRRLLATAYAQEGAATVDLHELVVDLRTELGMDDVLTVERLPQACVQREKMRLVFRNLLDNARRHQRPGVPLRITVGSKRHQRRLCVFVHDNGRGIPPAYQASIFEPFRRIPGRNEGGLGLGLYLVKRLVAQHGGDVWLRSREGVGTTFFLALPPRSLIRRESERQTARLRGAPAPCVRVARLRG
jgi:signal transduction histidine kinase